MSPQDLGNPLSSLYSIPGGQARLYERGLTVNGAGGEASLTFTFPMIGRPNMVTGNPATAPVFEEEPNLRIQGTWQLPQLLVLLQAACDGHLGLLPTGKLATPVQFTLQSRNQPDSSILVTAPTMQERQLYDVAILTDSGQWQVIAPHAVYHRKTWTDFGIASINDIHVARRIDSFREILVRAGRDKGARDMINWNDRFRGFVKYANHLHSIGVLDVILAIGDVYDYIYEVDDDPEGGGNAEFLRRLILGQAPGPDFPDVEELLVPIFIVPGNHDYRKHAYKLIFDIEIGTFDVRRIPQYSGFNLTGHDAAVLTIGGELPGVFEDWALDISPDEAARAVGLDRDLKAYKTFLADQLSYVVRLGDHRIAMLDSGPDTGIVTSAWEWIKNWIGTDKFTEDEASFIDSNPNSRGILDEDLDRVSEALSTPPDRGLVIVGVHAPLFNLVGNDYPYFLRETQRPAQLDQPAGFLARQSPGVPSISNATPEALTEAMHPLWFTSEGDNRRPTYVKRGDSQDMLDFGGSRQKADELIRLLAGVGSPPPADLVLSGHCHEYNEFKVRRLPSGELAYFMDFYTKNPERYYPTRFTKSWTTKGLVPFLAPVTDITYVRVVPGAAADATPSPLPDNDTRKYKYQLEIPPYPNPLSSASNSRAWWAEHRPLVLQTGALGPLKHQPISFEGFRVLAVENNVIENIYFISIADLEAHQYRRNWYDVIRDYPPKHPSPACAADATGNLHVCAINQAGGLWHTIRMADGTWQPGFADVQKETSSIGPTRYVACAADAKGNLHVCAIDQSGGLWHTMRMADGVWQPGFGDVQKETSSIGPTRHVTCAADATGNLHVCVIDQNGVLWHTMRMADGVWQPGFGDVQKETSSIGPTQHVTCAADSKGNLHLCAIDPVGVLWHTIRMADGTWQPGFGDVQKETSSIGPTRHVTCAADPKGDLHVCAIDQARGLWHTMRMADGTWPFGFGDVYAVSGPLS